MSEALGFSLSSFAAPPGAIDAKLNRDMLFIEGWRECGPFEGSAGALFVEVSYGIDALLLKDLLGRKN